MELRILSWNIHKGIGGVDRRYCLERISDTINQSGADIALLQEVADGWPRAGSELQGERLKELTELEHLAFAPEHRFKVGGYGNAILSRHPLTARHRIDLKVGWRKQRSALQAIVRLGSQRPVQQIAVTTLHLGLVESERRAQLRMLFDAEHVATDRTPMVLAGDFNDVFGRLERKFLQSQGFTRAVPRAPSFPAALPFFSLDGIFTRGIEITRGVVLADRNARRASDHRPLLATVKLA